MGAGTFPAGQGGAGLDPLPTFPQPLTPRATAALYFDGATADFPLDANGYYLGIDPIDQEVALALLIRLGTLSSVPELGAAFRTIRKITPQTVAIATDMANTALADLVSAKQIEIVNIDVQTRPRPTGAVLIAVAYKNLTTKPATPAVIKLNLNGSSGSA